jgi:hypothetical protein
MILEISAELDELLEKIQETEDLLQTSDPVARSLALGVVLARTIRDNFDDEIEVNDMVVLLMKKAEQIIEAMEELQIEGAHSSPKDLSN